MEKLVTTAQVAKALGISSRTLLRWVDQGWISPPERTNPSGHRRWSLERVRRELDERD
jgi:DNA-binding transcriptional MerR regulator